MKNNDRNESSLAPRRNDDDDEDVWGKTASNTHSLTNQDAKVSKEIFL